MPAVTLQTPDRPDPDHELTERQSQVLQVIRESMEKRGYPPSLREIGDAVGLTSTSSVSHHLHTLQRAGYLHRDSGRPRTVEVSPHTALLRVRSGTGFGLRRNAVSVQADDRPDGQGWDLVTTRFRDMGELAEYAASFGEDVVVLEPPDLREAVIARLKGTELEDRAAMSGPTAKPKATAGKTTPVSVQAARHTDMLDDDGVEEVAARIGEVAARIGTAMATGRRVHLRHYNWKEDEVTERDVDPMGLFVELGRPAPYLEGWCRLRKAVRSFRLDRVLTLEVLDVPASTPAEAEHANIDHSLFRPSKDDMRVELELSAPGRWVMESYPCESVTKRGDGMLRVVLRTPDTGWVHRLALRLGEDGRVVSPPALVAQIRNAAAAALANYAELPATSRRPPGKVRTWMRSGDGTSHRRRPHGYRSNLLIT